MLTQPSGKGRLSQDLNLWHSVPSYLISSVIKATQHPGNSVRQQGLDTWQSCSWSSGVSHLQEEVALVLSLLPKVTVLKDSSPLLDAWLLEHTLGINQKTLGSPLDCKAIKPVNPKGNEPWIFTGRIDAEAPILWPFDANSWLTGKTLMLGKIEGKRRMGGAEDEMVRYITNSMNRNLSKLWEIVEDRGSWHGVAKSGKWLGDWTSEQWEIAHFIIVMPPVHVHVMELSGGLPSEWIQLLSHVWQITVRC